MKYPRELENKVKEIESIITEWPVKKTLQEVMDWILQFETEDFDLAIRILRQLNVIGPKDFEGALRIAYSKLIRHGLEKDAKLSKANTIYCPIGSAGKSGAMVAYHFRTVNQLASSHFLDDETLKLLKGGKIRNLVLIDDIIATGDQSKKTLEKIKPIAAAAGINNVYLLSVVGFKDGIKEIQDTGLADVFSAIEYDKIDTIRSIDCSFFDGIPYEKRNPLKERISNKYKGPGYKAFGAFIVFYYNTPNCTLYSVSLDTDGWIPLFQRYRDLTNIDEPEFEQLTKEIEKVKLDKDILDECSIYTEGQIEEQFIAELASKNSGFGFKSLRVMPIGGFVSKEIMDKYRKMTKKSIFISDDSEEDYHESLPPSLKCKDVILMGNVMRYFNLSAVYDSPLCANLIGNRLFPVGDSYLLYRELELILLKRQSPTMRVEVMKELVNKCLNNAEVAKLIERIKEVYQ